MYLNQVPLSQLSTAEPFDFEEWLDFADRVLWNEPYAETEGVNRQQSRIDMYKKYGFSEPGKDPTGGGKMALDLRKDKDKDLHPEEDKAGLTAVLYPDRANKNKAKVAIQTAEAASSFGQLGRIAKDLPDDILAKHYNRVRASLGMMDSLDEKAIRQRLN